MRKKYLAGYLDNRTHSVNYHAFMGIPSFSDDENIQLPRLDLKRTNKDTLILAVYMRIF